MTKIFNKNRCGEHFNFALIAIFLSIFITIFAFVSEGNKNNATGFAASAAAENDNAGTAVAQPDLMQFKDVKSLSSMAAGNYYIDGDGILYWLDDKSNPAIAKVNYVDESQKNRRIYIDDRGNIGYVVG